MILTKCEELENGRYNLVPCPICGKTDELIVTAPKSYYELYDEHGSACISIVCNRCNLWVYEYDFIGRDYAKKMQILADKWNSMKGGAENGTEEDR